MRVQGEAWPGTGMHSHGWMAWATQGIKEGMGKWTKVQAMVWECAAVAEGARVHEMWSGAQGVA